jgi:hypothetical protein
MKTLFGLLISLGPLQSGESISWHFAQGTRRIRVLIRYSRHLHQVDGGNASSKYHTRSSSQVLAEYHIQVWCANKSLDKQCD